MRDDSPLLLSNFPGRFHCAPTMKQTSSRTMRHNTVSWYRYCYGTRLYKTTGSYSYFFVTIESTRHGMRTWARLLFRRVRSLLSAAATHRCLYPTRATFSFTMTGDKRYGLDDYTKKKNATSLSSYRKSARMESKNCFLLMILLCMRNYVGM